MTDTVNKQDDIVRGALGWTLATLIQVVAGAPVKNLDEVIAHAESVLSTPPTTPVQGYREALEKIASFPKGEALVYVTQIKEIARQALSQTDIQPCSTCHGVGDVTRITGLTPENYSEENMPCPDCTEDQPGPNGEEL